MLYSKLEILQRKTVSKLKNYGKKNRQSIKGYFEKKKRDKLIFTEIKEINQRTLLQKQSISFKNKLNENLFKNKKLYHVDYNIFFIIGGLNLLYSVFVYDFYANRHLQISTNFFLLLFHVTKKSVNILACILHLSFIMCQVYVLYIKPKISQNKNV